MIRNEQEFHQAVDQMDRMYRALASLKARQPMIEPGQFAVLAEGPIDEIRRLQSDLDAFLGVAVAGPA